MELTVCIPDDIAARLNQCGDDLACRALEAFALEEYKICNLSKPELRRMLGFTTRFELDGFFKTHKVYEGFTFEEIEEQVDTLKRLGF